jgi:hypothetical protein
VEGRIHQVRRRRQRLSSPRRLVAQLVAFLPCERKL